MPFLLQILHFAFQECAQIGHNVSFTYGNMQSTEMVLVTIQSHPPSPANNDCKFKLVFGNSDLQEMLFYCNF